MKRFIACTFAKNTIRVVKLVIIITLNTIGINIYFNHSLYTGIFPDRLKITVVKPLYEKEDQTSTTNYKPISILTAFLRTRESYAE